ncbi:DUF7837 family putative zinc-binding protein [Natronomonas moolapensis]
MSTTDLSTLGDCPRCSASVTSIDVLIEYKIDGQPAVYRLSRRMPRGLTSWMKPTIRDISH